MFLLYVSNMFTIIQYKNFFHLLTKESLHMNRFADGNL